MGRRVGIAIAVVVLVAGALACSVDLGDLGDLGFRTVSGSGEIASETREVSDFSGVVLAGWGNLHIEVGERESIRIEAEENLLEYIETEVRDGRLEIRHRRRTVLRPTEPINYYLTVKQLDTVAVTGAGKVDAPLLVASRFSLRISGAGSIGIAGLEAERVDLDITGVGDIDVGTLEADQLDVDISGAGNLGIAGGSVRTQEIGVSGGGNYNAKGLQSVEAEVRLSGLGYAVVRVSDRLTVSISGAGSVQYVGNPSVDKNISGVGKVQQIGA